MKFSDLLALAWRNLRQAKLRTALTTIGVVVGVGAVVTMVSFGIGLQENLLRDAFTRIDFFTTITVLGPAADTFLSASEEGRGEEGADRSAAPPPPVLDDEALEGLRRLPGVRAVHPQIRFEAYVRFEEKTRRIGMGAAPIDVTANPRFEERLAGRHFSREEAREAIVTERFLRRLRAPSGKGPPAERRGPFVAPPEQSLVERQRLAQSVIGQTLTILTLPLDDAPAGGEFDFSPRMPPRGEAAPTDGEALDRLAREEFTIVGVLPTAEGVDLPFAGNQLVYLPLPIVKRLAERQQDPLQQMAEMLTGRSGYGSAEVRVGDLSQVEAVQNEIGRLGFRYLSLGNRLEEVKRVFLIVNASLALIGGLALLVASFGISNTMIMSIRERTREIGLMKAIGGTDGEIMRIFLLEAGLIGTLGGILGLACGWTIDRVANLLANRWIGQQVGGAVRQVEFFSIPWYLWGGALAFAVLISLLAALYPALRAARIDPIRALRSD
jgi:putative ABC transport system permease protein